MAEEKRIRAVFELDASGFNSGLKGINSGLRNADAQMKLASQGLKSFGNDSTKLKSVQEALAKQVELQAKKVDVYRKAMENADKKMQENIKNRDKLKSSLDQANKKYEEAVKVYGKESVEAKKAKEEVDRLKQEHEKASKAVETNAKSIQNNDTNMKKAQATMQKTEAELRRIEAEIARNENKWNKLSQQLQKTSDKFKKIGGAMQSAGEGILKAFAPLGAAMVAGTKASVDFAGGMAKVSTIADTTKVPLSELRKGALGLSKDFGVGAKEITESMYQAISASVPTEKAIGFVGTATKAAGAGFTDATTAVDGLSTVLNSYGMQAEEADKIANQMLITQNEGKTTFGLLAGSMGQVTPISAQLNIQTKELFSSLAATTAQGLDTSESVTALKASMSNIIKPSEEASKAAEQLGIDFSVSALKSKGWMGFLQDVKKGLANASPEFDRLSKQMTENANKMLELENAGQKGSAQYKELTKSQKMLTGTLESMGQAADSPIGAMAQMFGSVKGLNSILMLTSEQGTQKYNKAMKEMETNTGALDDAFKKMEESPGEKWKKAVNEMKIAGIKLGDSLMPVFEKITSVIGKMGDAFSKMSPAQMKFISSVGLAGIAVGGFLKIGGKFVSSVGSFLGILSKISGGIGTATLATQAAGTATAGAGASAATAGFSFAGLGTALLPIAGILGAVGVGMYAVHKKNEYMNKSCIAGTEEIGKFGEAITLFTGQTAQSADQLDRNNIKYKDWNEKISPKTRKELDKVTAKFSDLSFAIDHSKGVKDLINSEDGKELNQKIDDIVDGIIKKIQGKQPKIKTEMTELFKADDGKISENEQKVLNILDKTNNEKVEKIKKIKGEIKEIEKKASQDSLKNRDFYNQQMEGKMRELAQYELDETVESKEELELAQANFFARIKQKDMQGTADLLAGKAKLRETEIKKIKEQYDTKIEYLKRNLQNMNHEEKKAAEIEIKNLETNKGKAIKKEQEKYDGFLKTAQEKYPQLSFYVNEQTGKMLTKQEQQKVVELAKYGEKMDGLLGITESGYYRIRNTQNNQMENCYVEFDQKTGKITGCWNQSTNEILGNPIKAKEDIDKDIKSGKVFRDIKEGGYDPVKAGIAREKLEVYMKENPSLFSQISELYNEKKIWLANNPLSVAIRSAFPNATGGGLFGLNWTGTNYFEGGMTALHDTPGQNSNYELYDLPRGTRIFNHDASADLVQKTAENVATKVANSVLSSFSAGNNNNSSQTIIVPVYLNGREIAKVTAEPMSKELAKLNRRGL